MDNLMIYQFSKKTRHTVQDDLPNVKNVPVGSTERQLKEEVDRLNKSIEDIKKLKEEIVKKPSSRKDNTDSDVAQ